MLRTRFRRWMLFHSTGSRLLFVSGYALLLHQLINCADRSLIIFQRCRHQGRQPRRNSPAGKKLGDAIEVIHGRFHRIDSHGPVDMYVDESGKQRQSAQIVFPVSVRYIALGCASDTRDAIIFYQHACFSHTVGQHDPCISQEQCGVSLHLSHPRFLRALNHSPGKRVRAREAISFRGHASNEKPRVRTRASRRTGTRAAAAPRWVCPRWQEPPG